MAFDLTRRDFEQVHRRDASGCCWKCAFGTGGESSTRWGEGKLARLPFARGGFDLLPRAASAGCACRFSDCLPGPASPRRFAITH